MTVYRNLKIGSSALVIGMLFFGCAAQAGDTDDKLTHYVTTLNANMPPNLDASAIGAMWHSDSLHTEPLGEPDVPALRGPKEVEAFFENFDEWFADWTHAEEFRLVEGNKAFWRGRAQGTHRDSGKPIDVPFAFYIAFDEDGLVMEKQVFHNPAQQMAQIE